MCTYTALTRRERTLITMSRDEQPGRPPEIPPRIHDGPPRWIGPLDSASMGTWMGVSEAGVVACLLNGYIAADFDLLASEVKPPSRGQIIPEALKRGDLHQIRRWLTEEFDPAPYPSFDLILAQGEEIGRYTWRIGATGHWIAMEGPWSVFSSSGWNSEAVLAYREEQFWKWLREDGSFVGSLPGYYLRREPDREEWGPIIDRSFSHTRSLTQAEVLPGRGVAILRHWPRPAGSLDIREPTTTVEVPLRGRSADRA